MKDFATLFKEAQFYTGADRRIGGNTLKYWYESLSIEDREVLNKGINEAIMSTAFEDLSDWVMKVFESFRLGLESINLDEIAEKDT